MNTLIYSTNEIENAVDYLEKAAGNYLNTNDKHRFKWLMISLHGALYSFGICNIRGTSPSQRVFKEFRMKKGKLEKFLEEIREEYGEFILTGKSDEAVLEYAKFLKGDLLSIFKVIEFCQSEEYMVQNEKSQILRLSEEQRISLEKLVYYRNQFAHFKPSSFGITGDYITDIVLPVVEIIKFLALETNNIYYDIYNNDLENRVEISLNLFSTSF